MKVEEPSALKVQRFYHKSIVLPKRDESLWLNYAIGLLFFHFYFTVPIILQFLFPIVHQSSFVIQYITYILLSEFYIGTVK